MNGHPPIVTLDDALVALKERRDENAALERLEPLIRSMTKKYRPPTLDLDDALQFARLRVIKNARQHYDPVANQYAASYITIAVRHAMADRRKLETNSKRRTRRDRPLVSLSDEERNDRISPSDHRIGRPDEIVMRRELIALVAKLMEQLRDELSPNEFDAYVARDLNAADHQTHPERLRAWRGRDKVAALAAETRLAAPSDADLHELVVAMIAVLDERKIARATPKPRTAEQIDRARKRKLAATRRYRAKQKTNPPSPEIVEARRLANLERNAAYRERQKQKRDAA